jgi:hypothetical protein
LRTELKDEHAMMGYDLQHLWGNGPVRAFISHVSAHKELAHDLKQHLSTLGVASFVAHDDIEPMKAWESEIEKALLSMHVLLALMSADFRNSKWTDQEVGVAVGRGVRVVAFRMGTDPYGFIGRYQAFSVGNEPSRMASEVFRYWLRGNDPNVEAVDAYIQAVSGAENFATSNRLAAYLDCIPQLSANQERALVCAFNGNDQAHYAWKLKSAMVDFLLRTTGHNYEFDGVNLRSLHA